MEIQENSGCKFKVDEFIEILNNVNNLIAGNHGIKYTYVNDESIRISQILYIFY
jgi:hypothetical protein